MNDSATSDDLTLGVLGGMGPQAGLDFMAKLIAATPVAAEQDHLRVILDSNPTVPDRNRAIRATAQGSAPDESGPGPVLAQMARGLQQAGADFLVMACNTAHAFAPDIRAAVTIPFVSIIDEAVAEAAQTARGAVGILAAQGCVEAGLFQTALTRAGVQPLLLDDAAQAQFMELLYRIKLGDLSERSRSEMAAMARGLTDRGAGMIIAGCTEVPLVLDPSAVAVPVLDSTAHLARRCVQYAKRREPLPRPLTADQRKA